MDRRIRSVDVGGGRRHHVTILDDPSPRGDRIRQHAFLTEVVVNGPYNGLWNCGPIPWQKMSCSHNGTQWVIEMEATEGEVAVTTRAPG